MWFHRSAALAVQDTSRQPCAAFPIPSPTPAAILQTSTNDLVLGAVILAGFLAVLYPAGKLLHRLKHAKFNRDWAPLIPVVGGTVHEDPQGGGATSWLVGTYRGRTIHARMSPDVRPLEVANYENRFAVGVAELDGAAHWRLVHLGAIVGVHEAGWKIETDDALLAGRLRGTGILEVLESVGRPDARYNRHERAVFLEVDVRPLRVPPRESFVALLEAAVRVAEVNERLNAVPVRG